VVYSPIVAVEVYTPIVADMELVVAQPEQGGPSVEPDWMSPQPVSSSSFLPCELGGHPPGR